MATPQETNNVKKVFRTTTMLIFLAAFIVVVLGFVIANLRSDITYLDDFVVTTADIKPNFEKSLALYSEGTKEEIDYLLELRPGAEEDYVKFISEVEEIGQDLNLELTLKSVQNSDRKGAKQDFIGYQISFFGTYNDMLNLLSLLESLPYLIAIENIGYRDLKFVDVEEKENKNVNILIKLFVK